MSLCLLAALLTATVSGANPVLSVLGRRESSKVRGVVTRCVAGVCADKLYLVFH